MAHYRPFNTGALVPYERQVVPIRSRKSVPNGGWTYLLELRSPSGGSDIHPSVPHHTILEQIRSYALFTVRQQLDLSEHRAVIVGRQWSFRLGTVVYEVALTNNQGRRVWRKQEELAAYLERVDGLM